MLKRILLVANTDWYLFNFRLDLIMEIKSKGFEPVLVSPPGIYSEKFHQFGIRHIPWKVGRKSISLSKEIKSIQQIKKIYKHEQPVLVHHHTSKAVIYGSIAARQLGIPIVNSIPGLGFVYSSDVLLAKILKPVLDLSFRIISRSNNNHHIIFENKSDLDYFIKKKFVNREKTSLIPSVGVSAQKFKPSSIPDGVFRVAFVGRLLQGKGAGVFVEAAKILAERKENCKMILVGVPDPGNPESYQESQILNWQESGLVEWWGWQEDMQKVYESIHVLAQPTYYGEGVPTTLVEAALSQRGVIASDWPGCREIIVDKENGLLIPPKDPAALADAIQYLANNRSEYDRMRLALFESAAQKFSTTNVNAQTFSVYHQLLE